jgi:tetratricopeptide (TPR) repeat protein
VFALSMVSVGEALELARTGNHQVAVKILKDEFNRLQSPEQRVELCEWIASCFEGLEDFANAGEWFEMAAVYALSETGSELANALSAIGEYEKAVRCYELEGDDESVDKCFQMIGELRHLYAAA